MRGRGDSHTPIRLARAIAALLAVTGPLSAGHAEPPADQSGSTATASPGDSPFDQAFAPFDAVPASPQVPAGAVDMAAIAPASKPEATDLGTGIASFYGRRFAGRATASGEIFDPTELTAAHRTLPFGSMVRVTNLSNGRSVVVRINDRGPYARNRVIDLSRAAAEQIDLVDDGHTKVDLALVGG